MAPEWYYTSEGQQFGPVSSATLRQLVDAGQIRPSDMLWRQGMTAWAPASSVKGVFSSPSVLPPLAPPPLPYDRSPTGRNSAASTPATAISCTRCYSENVQSLKLIYETGTSNIDTTSSGTVVGAGSSVGYPHSGGFFGAFTSGTTKGTQQTQAAKQASPPAKKDLGGPVVAIGLGIIGVIWFCNSLTPFPLLIGLLLIGGGIAGLVQAIKWNNDQWPPLFQQWLRSFRCLKCGEVFAVPEVSYSE